MNERELAAELQRRKDDPDEWGDVESGPVVKRRLSAMVSDRLSEDELAAVQSRAALRGETVSEYLRGLAIRRVTPARAHQALPYLTVSQMPTR